MLTVRTSRKVSCGRFHPLGATIERGVGVNFALYSKHATEVWLELYEPGNEAVPTDTIRLTERTRFIFHAFVHGIGAGQRYGYRVKGPFDPKNGHRYNENKLLVDPYAKALSGKPKNDDNLLLAYDPNDPAKDLSLDARDDARVVPKCIVVDDAFDWQGDRPPEVRLEQMLVYEVHLKGFTAHPSSGVSHPGSYLGFIEKIDHLVALGVNAVELLPIHERVVQSSLSQRGLTNYWGYDTIGFFAPESTYRAGSEPGDEVREMKTLVRELHRRGIEVILDVVYNHTAEGSELGPTVCFRGIDNATYYALAGMPDEPGRYYENWTGTGNAMNLSHPAVIRLVCDSLRYWVEEMHVDGFRFDLASVLGREHGRFVRNASFFDVVSQDPVLSHVKLIAEPWDLAAYAVGQFPVDWSEWNGRFRDTVRRWEKGDSGQLKELGYRLTGSSDLFGGDGRAAYNAVNFVTCHDGFTLEDLVSYDQKHNEANGEGNRDGADDNASWNSGAEGPTEDAGVLALRRQRAKNLISLLYFSAGTPMLLGGDELLRTQRGNNNAYCQDNDISWFDWTLYDTNRDMFDFVRKAIAFVKTRSVFARRSFFTGVDSNRDQTPDIRWYGQDLDAPNWDDPELRTVAYMLDGADAELHAGPYLVFVILNASWNAKSVRLPDPDKRTWRRVVDTCLEPGQDFASPGEEEPVSPAEAYIASPRSTVVLLAR